MSASGKAAADKKPAGGAAKGMSGRPSAVTPRAEGKHTLLPDKQHLHVAVSLRYVLTDGFARHCIAAQVLSDMRVGSHHKYRCEIRTLLCH